MKKKSTGPNGWNYPTYWEMYIDYDTEYTQCDGQCDYMCRCKVLVSSNVNKVYYDRLYEDIVGHKNGITNIKEYCLDRYLRKNFTTESVSIIGVRGYYGEESEVKLDTTFNLDIFSATDAECVEYVLELEYGYVLDSLMEKEWAIEDTVSLDHISSGYVKVDRDTVSEYCGQDNLVLCTRHDGKYFKLIDGNHRLAAARKDGKKEIRVIYCDG